MISEQPNTHRFGEAPLSPQDLELKRAMNGALLHLCGDLPEPLQGSAAIFLSTVAGTPPAGFDFIRVFYAPLWTVINHLAPEENRHGHAVRGHAMAMLLHLLDDHLVDGDEPADHMLLQLRTHAWQMYDAALRELIVGGPASGALTRNLIDGYFAAVHSPPDGGGLETYLKTFRAQIGTWLAVPMLLAEERREAVRFCLEEFSLAWRILDDVQDLKKDATQGAPTAVYYSLSTAGRTVWKDPGMLGNRDQVLRDIVEQEKIVPALLERTRRHLNAAARRARESGWIAYGAQIQALGTGL